MKFEQCSKAFFLYRNFPYLRDKLDPEKQQRFKRGHEVGELAQHIFPGGTDVSKITGNSAEALLKTRELIEQKCPVIYEATFMHQGVLVMVDILCFENNSAQAYEVKSSLKVSEAYVKDACLQYFVLKNVLPQFEDLFLVTIDGSYELGDELDLKKLFRKRSMKEKAEANLDYFETRVKEAEDLIAQNITPQREIGPHCFKPYTCDFFGHCWQGKLSDQSVFSMPFVDKLKVFEWYNSGITTLPQLSESDFAKPWQHTILQCILNKKPFIDLDGIRQWMSRVKGKVLAMDMEVWNPAVPKLKGCKPFEQIPFLIGLYGEGYSHALFCEHHEDEREQLTRQFIAAVQGYDSIVVYDKTLEVAVLKDLMTRFPEMAEDLKSIQHKLFDLFELISKNHYYHPDFKNNLSLKTLSAVVLPEFSYGEVQSGLEALSVYDEFRQENNPIHKDLLKQHLNEYCLNDCRAVFELLGYFKSL
ncbi:MAG: DUF2779 domain-containing protein [Bacteroidia bacterium]|nr:DUF2779 domain-containing protein [Bacteroidia bacterium]